MSAPPGKKEAAPRGARKRKGHRAFGGNQRIATRAEELLRDFFGEKLPHADKERCWLNTGARTPNCP